MAKSKSDLLTEAQSAGLVPEDTEADDYTAADLEAVLGGNVPVHQGSLSLNEPQVAPDGHVVLSQEDIDARNS